MTDASKRQQFIDYVRACSRQYGEGFAGQLRDLEKAVHQNVPSVRQMLDDAEDLRSRKSPTSTKVDVEALVMSFNERELVQVMQYMRAVAEYVEGKPFDVVYQAFEGVSRLKPIPATVRAPPGTFSPELIRAYLIN